MSKNYSSHASVDQSSRFFKAQKIEQLLAPAITIKNADILDIGTGSGYIAHYLATIIKPDGKITSIDVADQRIITSDYTFKEYSGQQLPFEDESFDIIISNHVIEHVGDREEQKKHLKEIYRVLKPKGIVYFAVPNKWTIMEPHFKLPFLSWLPHYLASKYIKTTNKGSHYDCYPPSHTEFSNSRLNQKINKFS